MSIRFDDQGFDRALRGALGRNINRAMADISSRLQAVLDAVLERSSGLQAKDVLALLRADLSDGDWNFTDDDLKPWANILASGQRIVIQPESVE